MNSTRDCTNEDVGNILLMEHVNVQVPDQGMAMLFYVVGLGFTRDPYLTVGLENMWINVGEQQFHGCLLTETRRRPRGIIPVAVMPSSRQRLDSQLGSMREALCPLG